MSAVSKMSSSSIESLKSDLKSDIKSAVTSSSISVAEPVVAEVAEILEVDNRPKWQKTLDNRYLRTFAIYLGLLLTASAYSNWQPLFLILDKMGAYAWICDENSSYENDFGTCDEQYDYMSQIYSVAGNMAYVVGLVAGVLMDSIGGRWTMVVGVTVLYLGWIMLIMSSESIQLYWPGLIFLGCAENLLGFPGFLPSNFFPLIRDLTASLCIAMQMLSSWMPVVIWAVIEESENQDAGRNGLIYYIVICAVPSVAMVWATPGRRSRITKIANAEIEAENSEGQFAGMSGIEKMKNAEYWKIFGKLVLSFDFILFCFWYVALTLGFGFYNTKIMEHAGQEIGEFIGILNPFRALFGPIMGAVSDWIGAFPMLILDNVFLVLGFGLALSDKDPALYTSAVFYILGRSFCFTTKYIYVQNFYPKEHFGKLCGLISLLGGIFGFLNVWFQVLPYDSQSEFIFCTVAMAVITVIPIYFLIKAQKLKKQKLLEQVSLELEDSSSSDSA